MRHAFRSGDAVHSVAASHVNIFASPQVRGRPRLCESQVDDMDKDNRDDFTFAKLSDLKVPVTLRMSAIFVESIPQSCA